MSEDLLRSFGPIEAETIIECTACNNTGSFPAQTHKDIHNNVVVDKWEDCKFCFGKRYEARFNATRKELGVELPKVEG